MKMKRNIREIFLNGNKYKILDNSKRKAVRGDCLHSLKDPRVLSPNTSIPGIGKLGSSAEISK